MGRKEKFVYNIHTLTYEKVVIPFKTRIWQAFGFFSVVLVTSFALLALLYTLFPSPREQVPSIRCGINIPRWATNWI
jgi:hypothetical protein